MQKKGLEYTALFGFVRVKPQKRSLLVKETEETGDEIFGYSGGNEAL